MNASGVLGQSWRSSFWLSMAALAAAVVRLGTAEQRARPRISSQRGRGRRQNPARNGAVPGIAIRFLPQHGSNFEFSGRHWLFMWRYVYSYPIPIPPDYYPYYKEGESTP